jgi:hypothetical protein
MNLQPNILFTVHRVLLFVGGGANNHNLLQEGRPFIMRLRQLLMYLSLCDIPFMI